MKAVHQVFENHALQQPERVAIVNGSSKVSYQQLNDHANTLAHALIQLGVGKDVFVGVLMPVGYRYISAMLSIFKANGVYLPLDWNFSAKRFAQVFKTSFSGYLIIDIEQLDRVRAMIAQFDVGLRYLIVLDKDQVCVFNSPKRELNPVKLPIAPKENPGLLPDMEANNYIYYTSGSTGEGKAIVGNHKALSHFIQWEIKEFGLDQSSRISQIAQITFDASLKDILTALCAGGTVCVPTPEEKQNLAMLARWIREQDLTLLQCVPSIFRLITQELRHGNNGKLPVYPKLKQVILAGEMLYAKDVQQWKEVVGDHVAVANLYGATESTILKTFYRINEVPSNLSQIIPVGKPMDDTSVAIINDNHICRVGEKGEIYIKTPFLTNGYYRNEELNSKAFVQNPLVSAKKDIVYKTGDVGRYLRSGDIEVLGRIDDQVKVNGVRVELGEIEGAMVSIQGINKAVVMPYEKSNAQLELVGYYSNATITQDEIRRALSLTLNAELIPTYLIHVDHFPLNINGKVNKKLLPRPDMTGTAMDNKEKPAGETEIQLAEIWKKVLSISEISRINSFFNIGGNSIKALQITSMIYQQFAVNLKLTAIFEYPTIESLAKLIDHSRRESFKSIQAIEEQEHYGLSYGQSRIWALLQLENDEGAYNMHTAFEITGGFNTKVFQRAFHILLQRHESLRTRFVEVEGQPRQKILPLNEGLSKYKVHDLRDSKDSIKLSQEIAVNNARKKFDLGQGPLFRIEIIQQTDQKLILLLAIHHIIADGWSTEILSRELASLYDQGLQGTAVVKPKQRIQYKDYVAWQKELLSDIALSDHRRYWLDQFEGEIPVLQLPTVYPRPAVKTYNGNRMSCLIDPSTSEKIITFCREHELSQYAFFLASINHLMFLYTGETDIIVGSPSSGRNHPDLESQIGFFLNNIPIRTRFDKHTTFQQLVEKIKKLTRDAQDHSDYPFHLLVTELNLKRDLSRSALYDIGFTWHDIAATEEAKGLDFEMARYDTPFVSAKGDLWFHGMNTAKGIVFLIEYNTDLFDQPWMNTFLEHMRKLVCEELENVSRSLNEYNYLSAAEREQLLEFAVTKPVTDASKSFLQAFCETVEICPGD
ncbi:MAG: amino acid adenylation domain-containing protein, partial [Bacteroidota bacterium]